MESVPYKLRYPKVFNNQCPSEFTQFELFFLLNLFLLTINLYNEKNYSVLCCYGYRWL